MESCLLCGSTQYRIIKKGDSIRTIGMCASCQFVQLYPRLTKQDYKTVHFDDWEHDNPYVSQLNAHKAYFRKLISHLRPFIKKRSPIKLLDVGCAIGALVMVAKEQGIEAEGIDIAKTAILYAKKLHLSVSKDTCESWFRKKQHKSYYNVITALEVIEHDENPLQMMKIINKMLHSGGIVALTTPNFNTVFRTLMGNAWIGYQHKEHLWFFTPRTIRRLLKDAGFIDIHVQKDFLRSYSVSYALGRLGDYFPILRPVMKNVSLLFGTLSFPVLFNPWGDMLVVARKPS